MAPLTLFAGMPDGHPLSLVNHLLWRLNFPPIAWAVAGFLFAGLLLRRGHGRAGRVLFALTAVGMLARAVLAGLYGSNPFDLITFHDAGRAVWAGTNPYDDVRFLNPPTALPTYAVLGLFSWEEVKLGFAVFSAAVSLVLAGLAVRALRADGEGDRAVWLPGTVAACAAAVAFGSTTLHGQWIGQVSLLVALPIYLALAARTAGRPLVAGLCLAVATIKPTLALPFLLLFLRPGDRRAWAGFAVGCVALILVATPAGELPGRLQKNLANIALSEAVGACNDPHPSNPMHGNILGVEHLALCLGGDRLTAKILQLAAVVGLAAWLVWEVRLRRDPLPFGPAASLVCLYSCALLYHRSYDTPVFALPLVYAAGRAAAETGPKRWAALAAVVLVLGVLNSPTVEQVQFLTDVADHVGPWGVVVRCVLVPWATWCLFGAMVAVRLAAGEASPTEVTEARVSVGRRMLPAALPEPARG